MESDNTFSSNNSYVEDLLSDNVFCGEDSTDIPRCNSLFHSTKGGLTKINLSTSEQLSQDGRNSEALQSVSVGSYLYHQTGRGYIVKEIKKDKIILRECEIKNDVINELGTEFDLRVPKDCKVNAFEYKYTISNESGTQNKKISVYDYTNRERTIDVSDGIHKLIESIPELNFKCIDEIRIGKNNQEGKLGSFRRENIGFTINKRVVTIYDSSTGKLKKEVLEALYHEFGHALSHYITGDTNPGVKWKAAMDKDGNNISEYSQTQRYPGRTGLMDEGQVEDFAETVRLYLKSDGGKSEEYTKLRGTIANRFAILDEIFSKEQMPKKISSWRNLIKKNCNQIL